MIEGGSNAWTAATGQDYAGTYGDTAFKWDGQYSANGHILYKEKTNYAKAGLEKFNILIVNGLSNKEVIFTFTYTPSGESSPITKGIKVDYSGLTFTN